VSGHGNESVFFCSICEMWSKIIFPYHCHFWLNAYYSLFIQLRKWQFLMLKNILCLPKKNILYLLVIYLSCLVIMYRC